MILCVPGHVMNYLFFHNLVLLTSPYSSMEEYKRVGRDNIKAAYMGGEPYHFDRSEYENL